MSKPPPSRREELLATAAKLFAERGFAGVRMDDIGAACGVSGPALYHHFASKDAMLGEMLVNISEHLVATAEKVIATVSGPDVLTGLVDAHAAFAVSQPELITVQSRDLVYAPEEDRRAVRRLQRRYVEKWVDVIGSMGAGAPTPVIRATVHAVFGLLNSTPYGPALGSTQTRALLGRLAQTVLDDALSATSTSCRPCLSLQADMVGSAIGGAL